MERQLWNVREAGLATGIPTKSMYMLVEDGTIPATCVVRLRTRIRIIPERLLAWLEAGGTRPHTRPEARPEAPPADPEAARAAAGV